MNNDENIKNDKHKSRDDKNNCNMKKGDSNKHQWLFDHCFSDFIASLNAATIITNDRWPLQKANFAFWLNIIKKHDDRLLNIRSHFDSRDKKKKGTS